MIVGYEAKRIFHNRSGLGNYGRNLLNALAGHYPTNKYILYNPSKGSVSFGEDLAAIEEALPPVKTKMLKNLWRQKLVSAQAANQGVKVFHGLSHELPADLRKYGIKSVVTIHDLIFLRYPSLYKWIDRKIYLKKVKLAIKRADVIVAISNQTRHDLMEILHVPPSKIKVIYQSCSPIFTKKQSTEAIANVKALYQLPKEYLLFVGTLEERKNPHLVVEAIQKVKLPVVFIGKVTKFWKRTLANLKDQSIQSLLYNPSVADNEHLAAIYQGAKLFVYPSKFEGFGIPVLEALESGIPVITSNRSSLPEAAGQHACLVSVEDAQELTVAIAEIWHDEPRRKEMILQGKLHAKHFTEEAIAKQWMELYKSLTQ